MTGLNMFVKRHGLAASGNGKARRLPRATLEAIAEKTAKGKSPETLNHHIPAIRSFCGWLERADRIRRNPLKSLSLLNSQIDVRHAKRELTTDELRDLLAATQQSKRYFRGLSGLDRSMLYLAATVTGFRARALAHLTTADFNFSGPIPTVTLSARFNKSKKSKVQPLPPDAAQNLSFTEISVTNHQGNELARACS